MATVEKATLARSRKCRGWSVPTRGSYSKVFHRSANESGVWGLQNYLSERKSNSQGYWTNFGLVLGEELVKSSAGALCSPLKIPFMVFQKFFELLVIRGC